jgi:type VI secretion system protein VasG
MNIDVGALIAKLNHEARSAVEGAAGLCLSRTHYDVELEHFLSKLLDRTEADFGLIMRHFDIDRSRLAKQLTVSLDRLKTGNARTPSLSPTLVKMLAEAWSLASVNFGSTQIRTGHAIMALALNDELRRLMAEELPELAKLSGEELKAHFAEIVAESAEEGATGAPETDSTGAPLPGGGKTPHLDQYTVDMTARAEAGEIDPVLGRDFEIRQVVDILTRRRQNNPILVGEAGVGKTAIVEGFASRLAEGEVPPVLRNVRLHSLDLALLQAGAGVKG